MPDVTAEEVDALVAEMRVTAESIERETARRQRVTAQINEVAAKLDRLRQRLEADDDS